MSNEIHLTRASKLPFKGSFNLGGGGEVDKVVNVHGYVEWWFSWDDGPAEEARRVGGSGETHVIQDSFDLVVPMDLAASTKAIEGLFE